MYERTKMVYACFLTTVELASGLSSPIKWAMVTLLYRLGTSDSYGTSLLEQVKHPRMPRFAYLCQITTRHFKLAIGRWRTSFQMLGCPKIGLR
jgi:hypothetical protein